MTTQIPNSMLVSPGGGLVQVGALAASATLSPNATAVQNAIAASAGGGAATSIAAGTVIPLGTAGNGSLMAEQTLAANSVFSFSGAIEGGNCNFSLIGNGVNFPVLSAFVLANGYAYSSVAGARNIYSAVYTYGTPLLYGVAGSAIVVAPGAATLAAGASTSTTQALTITAPATGGAPTSYATFYKRSIDPSYTAGPTGASLSVSITGLVASTGYDFKSVASNSAGPGPDSNVVTVSTAAAVAPSQRFATFDTANIVESGTGPYSYSDAISANAKAAGSNLRFPAGVAASLTYKCTLAGTAATLYFDLAFDTDATTIPFVAPPIVISSLGGTSYYSNPNTAATQVIPGSFIRIRRDAANTLYAEASADNVTWEIVKSIAGANVDYWPKLFMNPTTGGQWTFQSFSNSGMI